MNLLHRFSRRLMVQVVVVAAVVTTLWFLSKRIWPEPMPTPLPEFSAAPPGPDEIFVVLDAGHGGVDTGTSGQGLKEKDGALGITLRVARRLTDLGVKVVLTRSGDTYLDLDERVVPTARSGARAFVSVHLNSSKAKSVAGIETYFCSKRECHDAAALRKKLALADGAGLEDHRSELLAALIQQRASAATGAPDRGVRDSRLHVARQSRCPAVLVECGYLTNKEEALRLKRGLYQDKLASGIAEAVHEYLEKTSVDPRSGLVIADVAPVASSGAGCDVSGPVKN